LAIILDYVASPELVSMSDSPYNKSAYGVIGCMQFSSVKIFTVKVLRRKSQKNDFCQDLE
jgi:hypothetical protein